MKPRAVAPPPTKTVVTLKPVFRYSATPHRTRTWMWVAGAAVVVVAAAGLLLPYLR